MVESAQVTSCMPSRHVRLCPHIMVRGVSSGSGQRWVQQVKICCCSHSSQASTSGATRCRRQAQDRQAWLYMHSAQAPCLALDHSEASCFQKHLLKLQQRQLAGQTCSRRDTWPRRCLKACLQATRSAGAAGAWLLASPVMACRTAWKGGTPASEPSPSTCSCTDMLMHMPLILLLLLLCH